MKLLLLLVSLFVSDPRPLGDKDLIVDNYSWILCRKILLLSEQMGPRGLKTLLTQTAQCWMCIQSNCDYVSMQYKQWNALFYQGNPVHKDHGRHLSHKALTGIIHSGHFSFMIIFHLLEEGKRFPEFLTSDTPPAMRFISGDTSTAAGISHIAMNIVKNCQDSQSLWFVHHHSAASGSCVQTFLLEKSKSWATATIAQRQKVLTKRYCAAAIVIISCCLKEGEIRSAMHIKKKSRQQIVEPQMRQKENTQRVRDVNYVKEDDGQHSSKTLVNQQDILQAATPQSGSSSVKASDSSKLKVQRNPAGSLKENEHLNLDEDPNLQKSPEKQLILKAASRVDNDDDDNDDDDGFLLVFKEKKKLIKRLQYNLRAARDNNKNFNGKIITEQTELPPPEGEGETVGSHSNTIENGNQKNSANIPQSDFTEEGEEGLIILFLPDTQMETQTEPASARALTLNTDTGWTAVNIAIMEMGEPPPTRKNFIIKPDNSKCKCSLEMYTTHRTEGRDIKPAESITKAVTVTAYTQEEVKETTEYTETNNTAHENMSTNHAKQEENVPSEESVIPSPPLNKITETEMMKTDHIAETTTINMDIKETTSSMEVFIQSSTGRAKGPPRTEETSTSTLSPEPETDSEPRCIKCKTRNNDSEAGKLFTGLRMREDVLADIMKLHQSEVKNEDVGPTNTPENGRKEDENDPVWNSFTFSKPPEMIHKQATDNIHTTTAVPICRGLIHRTEAGWKHCMERFAGSKTFSLSEASQSAFQDTGEHTSIRDPSDSSLNDDEYDHFYYFDGVSRRVQSHFYPHHKRQTRQANAEKSVPTLTRRRATRESLLSYIQRLALKNHFKR